MPKATDQWVRIYGPMGHSTKQLKDLSISMLAELLTNEHRWCWVKYDPETYTFTQTTEPDRA